MRSPPRRTSRSFTLPLFSSSCICDILMPPKRQGAARSCVERVRHRQDLGPTTDLRTDIEAIYPAAVHKVGAKRRWHHDQRGLYLLHVASLHLPEVAQAMRSANGGSCRASPSTLSGCGCAPGAGTTPCAIKRCVIAAFPLVCIGYFGNNVFPFRAGGCRSVVLRKTEDIASSLATVFIARIRQAGDAAICICRPALCAHAPEYRRLVVLLTLLMLGATAVFMWMAMYRGASSALHLGCQSPLPTVAGAATISFGASWMG